MRSHNFSGRCICICTECNGTLFMTFHKPRWAYVENKHKGSHTQTEKELPLHFSISTKFCFIMPSPSSKSSCFSLVVSASLLHCCLAYFKRGMLQSEVWNGVVWGYSGLRDNVPLSLTFWRGWPAYFSCMIQPRIVLCSKFDELFVGSLAFFSVFDKMRLVIRHQFSGALLQYARCHCYPQMDVVLKKFCQRLNWAQGLPPCFCG